MQKDHYACFFTNDLPKRKEAWVNGSVFSIKNDYHQIAAKKRQFNSLMQIQGAIEKLLVDCDIKLHTGNRMQYLKS